MVLNSALESTDNDLSKALPIYTAERAIEAKSMVQLSKRLDGGFFSFIFPLIIDSIFHKLFPKIFFPNVIASFQNEKYSFSEVARRKRLDRVMQAVAIGGLSVFLYKTLRFANKYLIIMFMKLKPFFVRI
jgi:kynurenine 3-monooxygenase